MCPHSFVGFLLVFECLLFVVLHSLEHPFGLFFLALLLLLLPLLLLVLLRLLLFVLLLLILILILLLILLLVLVLLLLLLFVLLVFLLLLVLLLLLLLLLEQPAGIGQIVSGVFVLGVEFECRLIAAHGLLQSLHLSVMHGGLKEAVPLVVKRLCTLLLGEVLVGQCLFVVAGCLAVFLLPVKSVGQIVLSTKIGRILFQGSPVGHLGLVVVLLLVLPVAFPQLMPVGLGCQAEGE